jgi:hypothetical protein
MAIDWLNLVVGAIFGFLAHWGFVALKEYSVHCKLKKAYRPLAGDYVNFKVSDDKTEQPTGGTIKLTQRSDGSFEVKGLHRNGALDWRSELHMTMEPGNTGTGWYRYPATTIYGTQQITFIPETRSIHVVTTDTSRGTATSSWVHHWKRKE